MPTEIAKRRPALLILLSGILLIGGISAWIFVSLPPLCGNDIVEDVRSPDGQHRAILFVRNCGATTGFYTQIALIGPSEELPNEAGNVLSVKGTPGKGLWEIEWTGAETLIIRLPTLAQINRGQKNVEGITIQFEPLK